MNKKIIVSVLLLGIFMISFVSAGWFTGNAIRNQDNYFYGESIGSIAQGDIITVTTPLGDSYSINVTQVASNYARVDIGGLKKTIYKGVEVELKNGDIIKEVRVYSKREWLITKYYLEFVIDNKDYTDSATVIEGESVSLTTNAGVYNSSISFISTSEVKLVINGEITSALQEKKSQKLKDGSTVIIKRINVQDYAGGSKMVEFMISSKPNGQPQIAPPSIPTGYYTLTEADHSIGVATAVRNYDITINSISESKVKLLINTEEISELTNELGEKESQKLKDGSTVMIDKIIYQTYAGGSKLVIFKIEPPSSQYSGEGNAFACFDSNGNLYRSKISCR
jgi:hypothetical protein